MRHILVAAVAGTALSLGVGVPSQANAQDFITEAYTTPYYNSYYEYTPSTYSYYYPYSYSYYPYLYDTYLADRIAYADLVGSRYYDYGRYGAYYPYRYRRFGFWRR